MAIFYATSGIDIFGGTPGQSNTYYFAPGELSSLDLIIGAIGSPNSDFMRFTGTVNLSTNVFGGLVGIDGLILESSGNDTIVIPHSIVAASDAAAGQFYVTTGDGNDIIDASQVLSSEGVSLWGGSHGNDTIIGGDGDDEITGSDGDNVLNGGLGADTIFGGLFPGSDSITATADELDGDELTGIELVTVTTGGFIELKGFGADHILLSSAGNELEMASRHVTVDGGAAADEITMSQHFSETNDFVLDGNGGNDIITSSSGDDTLTGGSGIDLLNGWSGDDVLDGGSSGDLLTGGSGDDTYLAVESGDLIFELSNGGSDALETALTAATLPVNVENMTYTGTIDFTGTGNASSNAITGKAGDDTIAGAGGNDTLTGNNGDDDLGGGSGNDTVQGLGHSDLLHGWTGQDVLEAGRGNDTVYGGYHADTIKGGPGLDLLYGEAGADWIQGGDGSDTIDGGAGNDTAAYGTAQVGIDADLARASGQVITGAGTDELAGIENFTGTAHDDTLRGDTVGNILTGSNGNDTMWGLAGDDVLDGGAGIDQYHPSSGNDTVYGDQVGEFIDYFDNLRAIAAIYDASTWQSEVTGEDAGTDLIYNIATLYGGAGNDTISFMPEAHGGDGDDWLIGSSDVTDLSGHNLAMFGDIGFDTVFYETLGPYFVPLVVDLLAPNMNQGHADGDDYVSIEAAASGWGDDYLYGNDEDNRLSGGGGLDVLDGRLGNDTLDGGLFTDIIYGGEGDDWTDYSLSSAAVQVDLSTNINRGGDADGDWMDSVESVAGSAFADTLTGNGSANSLDGGAGADTMTGAAGDDTYVIDDALDVVTEAAGEGIDQVEAALTYTLLANFEDLVLTGSDSVDGTGNAADNRLTGNSANNVLNGTTGDDTTIGGAGDDVLYVNAAGDSVEENAGEGSDTLRSTVTVTLGPNIEHLILAGTLAIDGTGNDENNSMTGNTAVNNLNGLDGNDTMNGGAGTDSFAFTTALASDNVDTLFAFSVADDTIELDNAIFTGLALGALAATAFVVGAAAVDASDRIVYNSATGALSFDSDGTGAAVAIQFATLGTGFALTNLDFVVV